MPRLQEFWLVLFDRSLDLSQIVIVKTSRLGKPHRGEPEFRRRLLAANVNMGWFIPFRRVEKN
jgi:hypothetical protein